MLLTVDQGRDQGQSQGWDKGQDQGQDKGKDQDQDQDQDKGLDYGLDYGQDYGSELGLGLGLGLVYQGHDQDYLFLHFQVAKKRTSGQPEMSVHMPNSTANVQSMYAKVLSTMYNSLITP